MSKVSEMLVKDYCSEINVSAQIDTPLSDVSKKMADHKIRHIPIVKANKFAGIISDRDLKLVAGLENAMDLTAGEIMSKDPYIVSPDTKIVDIMDYFIHNKISSALVDGEKQLYIFTVHDALKILKNLG